MTGGKVPARRTAEKTSVVNTGAAVLVPVGLNVEKEKAQQSELMLGGERGGDTTRVGRCEFPRRGDSRRRGVFLSRGRCPPGSARTWYDGNRPEDMGGTLETSKDRDRVRQTRSTRVDELVKITDVRVWSYQFRVGEVTISFLDRVYVNTLSANEVAVRLELADASCPDLVIADAGVLFFP